MVVPSRKQEEIAELLRRELSNIILYELNDPRVGFVTVTRVKVSKDTRSAEVFVTVRGSESEVEQTIMTLHRGRGYMQKLIAERLRLRWTPLLQFSEDKDLVRARRVMNLIDRVREEDKKT